MSEIVAFSEGSAQFATADGAFVTMLFVRNAQLNTPRLYAAAYRPPYSLAYTHVDYQSRAGTFGMSMAEGPDTRALKAMLANAVPGTVHCHVFGIIPNVGSAGFYAYSGRLEAGNLTQADGGGETTFGVEGWTESWSAY